MSDTENVQGEQEVSTLSDDELNATLDGGGEPDPHDGKEPEPDQGEPEKVEAEGGNEQPEGGDLKAQVEELNRKLEETENKLTHWRQVGNRHSEEISQVRNFKERLLAEKQAREQADPMQSLIDNPQQYHRDMMNDVQREHQLADLERHEQALMQQHRVAENINFLKQTCPDLPENLDGITEMLRETGDSEDKIAAFRQNPGQFPPNVVMAVNYAYRERKAYRELQEKFDAEKAKSAEMFQRIEQTAKQRPMTNATSGSASGGGTSGLSDITEADIAELSDEELNNLLSA